MQTYELTPNGITQGLDDIEAALTRLKVKAKALLKTRLMAEETLLVLKENAPENTKFFVQIHALFGGISVKIKCRGAEFDLADCLNIFGDEQTPFSPDDAIDEVAQTRIRSLLLRGFSEQIRFRRKGSFNEVTIVAQPRSNLSFFLTIGGIVLAIVIGFVLRNTLAPTSNQALCDDVLNPIKTIYMNLLNVVVGPVVFFSLASCMGQFSDLSSFGRIGAKTFGIYLASSLVSIVVACGFFHLIDPGSFGSLTSMITENAAPAATQLSVSDIIIGFFPDNLLGAFVNANVLQIMLLAIFMGICANLIGEKGKPIQRFFDVMNELFMKMVTLLAKLIPLIAFCSVMLMILTTGADTFLPLVIAILTAITSMVMMVMIYTGFLSGYSHLNPKRFFKKYASTALNVFSLSSSSASVPINMDFCKRIGIPQKIYAFTIPFGATVNMNGTIISNVVISFFMAKMFGIDIETSQLTTFFIMTVLMSMAAPGVPGSAIVVFMVLMDILNIPNDCLPLVLVMLTMLDMVSTVTNTTGDVFASIFVSHSEKLLDREKFNRDE